MAYIKVYLFQSKAEANAAINLINTSLGIPQSNDSITQTYCDYSTIEDGIVIYHDDIIESILGAPLSIDYKPIITTLAE